MSMHIIAVNAIGTLLIIFVIWWFWLYRPRVATVSKDGLIDIIVDNGVYEPAVISTLVNHPITLRFTRKTTSPCAATVLFPELNISAELPLDVPQMITLVPNETGVFEFTCQMAMYRGKLLVVSE